MADVACLGILVADVWALPIDEWPQRGRLSLVDELGMGLGGCAANTGLALDKLGVDTAVMGKVGDDGFGHFVTDTLQDGGANIDGVVVDPGSATSATMIMIDSEGERTFLHYPGANGTLRPGELDIELAGDSKILHFAGALVMGHFDGEPMAQVMRDAAKRGATISLDTVWDDSGGWMDTLQPCLKHTQLFLPSLAEAQELTRKLEPEDVAQALLDYGVEIVALKDGPNGSYVASADTYLHVPAYEVKAVDGTGAGDAYVAGFLRGYLDGWDLERTAKFANAIGALCTTAVGTLDGVRSYPEAIAFLKEREPDSWGDF
ncbi:MAG: carbohydrate kinase family protein [Armatimonadota bacterium]